MSLERNKRMENFWSDYIQTTEELYLSRDLRFTDANKDLWLSAIGAKSGGKILEIGCAGGAFCHKIKKYIPDTDITGIDLDTAHIEFAKKKSIELGINCNFTRGDALDLPFENETFDLCYSHTVAEHIPHKPFYKEQKRVLKKGGRITVLSVRTRLGLKDGNFPQMCGEELSLFEKAWGRAKNFDAEHDIGKYEIDEHEYPKELEKAGFGNISVKMFTVMDYAPDSADVSDETAMKQINSRRIGVLSSVQKALKIAPDALSDAEKGRLLKLINNRFDERIEKYKNGQKLWDFSSSTVLAVSGIKP